MHRHHETRYSMEGSISASKILPLLALSLVLALGISSDVLLIIVFKAYKNLDTIHQFLQNHVDLIIQISRYVLPVILVFQTWKFLRNFQTPPSNSNDFPVKPLLFQCQTSHIRLFPKKHGFSYSYLQVGIPVGFSGHSGGMISVIDQNDTRSWFQRWFSLEKGNGWWTVNGDDYLARGHCEGGLTGKLREYLISQGRDPEDYAHASLITAARFQGYAFNPLSVWHLYSHTKELKALILEVNNTNDERRIYFLFPSSTAVSSRDPEKPDEIRYTGTWGKDFYVSTFNDQSGKYSAAIYDPLAPNMSNPSPTINTTITLSTSNSGSDSKPILIARLYSTTPALDPESMTVLEKIGFLVKWWWVGYMTFFPRTVFEAYRLFFKKGVKWVSRPEPRRDTMPRHANSEEICIERCFRVFLEDRVKMVEEETGWVEGNVGVRYIPAGLVGDFAKEAFYTRSLSEELSEEETVEIRVLTPLFYSRIVQYSKIHTGLLSEIRSGTVEISNLHLLGNLDLSFNTTPILGRKFRRFSLTDFYLYLIQRLRPSTVPSIPAPESLKSDLKGNPHIPYTIPGQTPIKRLSGLDIFTASSNLTSREEVHGYLKSIIKILIAEMFFLGWLEVVDFEVFLFRVWIAWIVSSWI